MFVPNVHMSSHCMSVIQCPILQASIHYSRNNGSLLLIGNSLGARTYDSLFQLLAPHIPLSLCLFPSLFPLSSSLSVLFLSMTSFRRATNGCPRHAIHSFCLSSVGRGCEITVKFGDRGPGLLTLKDLNWP